MTVPVFKDLSTPAVFVLINGIFLAFVIIGSRFSQGPFRCLSKTDESNAFISYFMVSTVLFTGVSLAVIVNGLWQSYHEARLNVLEEATTLYTLYKQIDAFSEPTRTILKTRIRDYTEYILYTEWPQMREGRISNQGLEYIDNIDRTVYDYNPQSDAEQIVMDKAIDQIDQLIQLYNFRRNAVRHGLANWLWIVLIFASFLVLFSNWFLTQYAQLHLIMSIILGLVVGSLIFLTIILDRPYTGDNAISPEPFQTFYMLMRDNN